MRRLISSGSPFEAGIGYSRAVVDGEWIFVSGTTGFDYEAMTISSDVREQAEQTMRNIGQALSEAGSSFTDIVRVRYIFLDVADFEPVAFLALRWIGGLYLVWLGVKLLLGAGRSIACGGMAPRPVSDLTSLREGALSSLTNPKSMVFMLAFLPQFVDPSFGWPVTVQLLVLGAVQKLSGFVVMAAVALGAGTFGGWLASRPALIAWQERFAGLVMVGLGLRLVLSGDARSTR